MLERMDERKQTGKIPIWKAAGPDGVQGYWLKNLSSLHDRIACQLNVVVESGDVPLLLLLLLLLCLSVFVRFYSRPRPNHGPEALSPVFSQVINRALLRMCDVPSKTIFWISSMQILPGIFDT